MSDLLKDLKLRATEAELHVIEYPDGRVLVVGGLTNVHWWPTSKKQTAYVDGAPRGRHYATPKQVISMALKGRP